MISAKNVTQLLVSAVAVTSLTLGSAHAQLASSVLNADFETGIPTGNVFNNTVPSWDEFGDFADSVGLWDNTDGGLTDILPINDLGAGSLIIRGFSEDDAWLFQSLGTLDGSDVGTTFSLSAELGARDEFGGGAGYGADADLSVAFRTGTTNTGDLGTALGTVGTRNIVTTNQGGFIPFTTQTATFTPSAGDIGTEVFAVLSLKGNDFFGGFGQRQYTVDDVSIGTIDLGDFNNDTFINLTDYGILRDNLYGHLDGAVGYPQGDINFDNMIDLEDFNDFLAVYPGGAAAFHADLAALAVPEPAGIALVSLGLAGIVSFARRSRV